MATTTLRIASMMEGTAAPEKMGTAAIATDYGATATKLVIINVQVVKQN